MYFGVIVDTLAIFLGGTIGLLVQKGIPKRIEETIMRAIGLSAVFIGITGMTSVENTIFIVLAMVFGGIIGEILNLDKNVNRLANSFASKLQTNENSSRLAVGFVTGALMMSVGPLSIIGPIESGLTGDHTILYTNAVLDGISSLVLTSSLGLGVILSGFVVFVYEALIVMFASSLNTFLTEAMILDMSAIGAILILVLGLNILKITDIKVMNFVPALFIPIALFFLY